MTENKQTIRRRYLKPIFTIMIDMDYRVDQMAINLNELGTKDQQHNNWHPPAIEAYLVELGFPDYAHTHQPAEDTSSDEVS